MMPFALSMLAKATITTTLALLGTRRARRSRAASRHVLLAAAFIVLLVLPIASLVLPPVSVAVPIAGQASEAVVRVETRADAGVTARQADAGAAVEAGSADAGVPWPSWPVLMAGIWVVGTTLFLLPVIAGLSQVGALRRSALPWRRGQSLIDPLALEGAIRRRVDVVRHESLPGPMTCGLVRPTIVLPMDAEDWDEADLRRALVHELEHVRRGDWLTHCLARSVCAFYWFHPLVWMASRALALEAERACDDAVIRRELGADPEATAYADQLVGLAERLSTTNAPLLAMANRADLTTRVRAVLDGRQLRGRAGTRAVAVACAAAALLVTTMAPLQIVARAYAQMAQGTPGPDDARKFEVISIKPCEGEAPTPPGQRSSQGGFPQVSPGRFTIECGTVERLISNAYVLNGDPLANQQARIGDIEWLKNVPSWLRSEKFTIEAKAEGTPDRKVMLGPMLRNLLEDRFKLKIHRENDERPVYVMTVAKGGLKIVPDTCEERDPDGPGPGRDYAAALAAGAKPICGVMNMMGTPGLRKWTIGGATLEHFASTLSTTMDYFVIDKTGVADKFNIHLEFAPDEHVPGGDKRYGPPTSFPEPDGPTIFKALEQQLGLKLDLTKGAHGFLVIDHIERPTPNSGPGLLDLPAQSSSAGPGRRR